MARLQKRCRPRTARSPSPCRATVMAAFDPKIAPKRARRVGQIDELVLSCYARGMSTRDIEAHLLEVYGVKASHDADLKHYRGGFALGTSKQTARYGGAVQMARASSV